MDKLFQNCEAYVKINKKFDLRKENAVKRGRSVKKILEGGLQSKRFACKITLSWCCRVCYHTCDTSGIVTALYYQKSEVTCMELLETNATLMMRRSMEFLWQKQSCILDNIANVETPGYKTKYATFEQSLESALRSADEKNGTAAAYRQAIEEPEVQLHEADESVRLDDNGVNITEQSVELARNGYQLQYVMNSISSDLSLLRTAIRG